MDEEAFSSAVMEDISYLKGKGFVSSRFIAMVNSKGALAAAKELVARKKPSDGLLRLWELKELKCSIEYRMLDERWKKPVHRRGARDRQKDSQAAGT